MPGAEQIAHGLHARQQVLIDDRHGIFVLHGLIEVIGQSVAVAVDDSLGQAFQQWQCGQLLRALIFCRRRTDPLEQLHEDLQRVIVFAPAVINHIQRDLALLFIDPVHRNDLRAVGDGRIQARLHALIEEHGVEYLTGSGVQTEGNIGKAQRGVDLGVALLQLPDGRDGFNSIPAGLLLPGGDGEREAVHDDVFFRHTPGTGDIRDETLGDLHLLLASTSLSFFINGQGDHGRAVLLGQAHDLLIAGIWPISILEVHGVHRTATTEVLQSSADHGGFGGVDHHRQGGVGSHEGGQGGHVIHAIAAHVVNTEVNQVCTIAHLVLGDLQALFQVPGQHGLAECLGTIGVCPLANHGYARFLGQWHGLVKRGDEVVVLRVALGLHCGLKAFPIPQHGIAHRGDVFRRGATATADHGKTVVLHESAQRSSQLGSGQRVFSTVGAQHG